MPVNYLQIEKVLELYAQHARGYQSELKRFEESLWENFSDPDRTLGVVREKVSLAEQQMRSLYCAKPISEALLTHKPAPTAFRNYTLIAADGSQITPNRHRTLQFCVINVGLIKAHMGSGEAPEINILSQLLAHDQLFSEDGSLIGDDIVALHRDLAERQALLDFAPEEAQPTLTLTDGPLDVYLNMRAIDRREKLQNDVKEIHAHLEERHVISAGYIDKPGSEMISRMLNLLQVPSESLRRYDDKQRTIRGISDARLLRRLLHPGERSAIFEAVTKGEGSSSLKVHFFYLNVGTEKMPYLVRVEFPAWVSQYPQKIDLLHAAIYSDVQVLDTHPYPYLLHRAHELAVISLQEHDYVEDMLLHQFELEGVRIGLRSNKEANKQL
ncbi:MAG: DNA double-strand break repair nuclease NurA [Anaerolineaceae bacterium]